MTGHMVRVIAKLICSPPELKRSKVTLPQFTYFLVSWLAGSAVHVACHEIDLVLATSCSELRA